jgi:hypothetical protein
MAFPIQPKRNATADSATPPVVGDLLLGELAVNTQSKKTFLRVNGNEVVEVGWDRILSSDAVLTATADKVVKLASTGLISKAQISGLQYDQIGDATQTATANVANKIPLTGADGKIAVGFIPAGAVGGLTYKGAWAVNSSPVMTSGGFADGVKVALGSYYVASNTADLSPAIDGQTKVAAGDLIAFNGTTWDFIDGAKNEVILNPSGKIPDGYLNLATTSQLGVISVDPDASNGLSVSVAGAAKIIPGTATVVGGIKSSDSIEISVLGVATVASAGTY